MVSRGQSPRVEILASTLVTGGAERVIEALATGLGGRGFPARVLCLRGPGEVGAAIAERGVTVVSGIARVRFDPWACARLASLLRGSRDAALLVLDHHDAVFAGAIAGRLAGVRHRLLAVHSTGLWGKRSSFSRSDRVVLGSYERIIALAGAHAAHLAGRERIDRTRITIIPNGVDTERFRPPRSAAERDHTRRGLGIAGGTFVVSIVAALRPEKNHGMLLEAASRIAKTRDDFVFLIVGEGSEGESLRRRARALSLGDRVRFLGRREDVSVILAATDASVLCSHSVVETFPLAVLEAMACGVPVVTTDVGAVREMLVDGEEGFVIAPGDVDALVGALTGLAGRAGVRGRMGTKARERVVRDFTIDAMVGRYAALFDEVLGR